MLFYFIIKSNLARKKYYIAQKKEKKENKYDFIWGEKEQSILKDA